MTTCCHNGSRASCVGPWASCLHTTTYLKQGTGPQLVVTQAHTSAHAAVTLITILQATDEELLMCHSKAHIKRVEQLYANHKDLEGNPAKQEGDTYIISSDIY